MNPSLKEKFIFIAIVLTLLIPLNTLADEEDEYRSISIADDFLLEALKKLTYDYDYIFSPAEREFFASEITITEKGKENPINCNANIFVDLVKLGIQDTLAYALYPSGSELTPRVWKKFLDRAREYIILYEKEWEDLIDDLYKDKDEKHKPAMILSGNNKFSKNGMLLLEIWVEKYMKDKILVAKEVHFLKKCGQSMGTSADITLLDNFIDNSTPQIKILMRELYAKEQVEVYRSFWQALSLAMRDILNDISGQLRDFKRMYEQMVADITQLPPKQ